MYRTYINWDNDMHTGVGVMWQWWWELIAVISDRLRCCYHHQRSGMAIRWRWQCWCSSEWGPALRRRRRRCLGLKNVRPNGSATAVRGGDAEDGLKNYVMLLWDAFCWCSLSCSWYWLTDLITSHLRKLVSTLLIKSVSSWTELIIFASDCINNCGQGPSSSAWLSPSASYSFSSSL